MKNDQVREPGFVALVLAEWTQSKGQREEREVPALFQIFLKQCQSLESIYNLFLFIPEM